MLAMAKGKKEKKDVFDGPSLYSQNALADNYFSILTGVSFCADSLVDVYNSYRSLKQTAEKHASC